MDGGSVELEAKYLEKLRTNGLVPCALCGEEQGYKLQEGCTYRWWSVQCAACGQEVAEARVNNPDDHADRTTRADDAWNNAGAYAARLRAEFDRVRAAAMVARDMLLRYEADASNPGPACIRGRLDAALGPNDVAHRTL